MNSARKAKTSVSNDAGNSSHPSDLMAQIAVSAYYKAETRGFAPGRELDDWMAAEAEINFSARED